MAKRVLIAARGEIAVRVARAARELGWEPITIYEDADRSSPHVRAGVVSVPVKSYTDMDSIIDAALKTGADIVHPGYGFLSESPEFAERVLDAGISWAGPHPKAMRMLGDKASAKALAEKLGVPTLPWCRAESPEEAEACAEKIGYPVVLKASRAGGGRGMRVARRPGEAASLYKLVAIESRLGFGSGGEVYVERYIEGPRHIEVQVLGDEDGRILHLYERECSLQRRRQKIVEEAPSPFVQRLPGLRNRLLGYALFLAESVGYTSAGTIEFIVDRDGNAYFIEANTRLQVEHGVTEEVTGVDIVKMQLLVAAGGRLPLRQENIGLHGWAIEARIYAEDPWAGFQASEGVVTRYREPRGPGVRVDSGVEEGQRVSSRYDTLLAKVIARGMDRGEAIARLRTALQEMVVSGVETNLDLLRVVVGSSWFADGEYSTTLLEEKLPELLREAEERRALVAAIASQLHGKTSTGRGNSFAHTVVSHDYGWPWPPWRS
ncbi:Pyruvate carboxyl transferase subunit A [Pyrodictium delaneyi]|uniref:Pyruvate carboxyl transferase subunit A n=1 Tax=Pyrodictium delaneyi TaxID=1273541 RepID=A0A0P0N3M4_9CREN|nr:biotin carboxylase N-terminal domain-containing protein [Pyrodictium delaneyi]ALL01285.1 Pyruvate carboxyl transferase subunit A [Pyrodictium delaneyi]OWJ55805.1 hypothetical protein Pdsh_02345 [Pyrodictium delaneyi]